MWGKLLQIQRDGGLADVTAPCHVSVLCAAAWTPGLREQCFLYESHPVVEELIIASTWTRC